MNDDCNMARAELERNSKSIESRRQFSTQDLVKSEIKFGQFKIYQYFCI
jgi:hypothetical protein